MNGFSDLITINRFYRMFGVPVVSKRQGRLAGNIRQNIPESATAAGAEANAEAPRSVINWYY
jgi:hypothetical protein